MIDETFAKQFASQWIDAWNSHDLERILSHYAEEFEMQSPLIVERMHEPSGRLVGKAAIRPYWQAGLAAQPRLEFTLDDVLVGANSVAIAYHRENGSRVVEVMSFDERRRAVTGLAHYAR